MAVGMRKGGCLRLELSWKLAVTALGYSECMQDFRWNHNCDSHAEPRRIGSRRPFNIHVRRTIEMSTFSTVVMLDMKNATCYLTLQ